LVLHLLRDVLRRVEDLLRRRSHPDFAATAAHLREPLQLALDDRFELLDVRADLAEQGPNDPLLLVQQGGQQVQRLQLRMPKILSERMRLLNRLLSLDRQFVEAKGHDPTFEGATGATASDHRESAVRASLTSACKMTRIDAGEAIGTANIPLPSARPTPFGRW